MDDFGTGYSSLSYLKRLPVQRLKIDPSFVRGVATGTGDAAIVKMILRLARELGIQVTAEGVETDAQLAWLAEHQCEEYQGSHLSKPLPAHELARLLALQAG